MADRNVFIETAPGFTGAVGLHRKSHLDMAAVQKQSIRGLDKEYATVMGMLYMITRMGNAKDVTDTFRQVMGRQPHSFALFAVMNKHSWENPNSIYLE